MKYKNLIVLMLLIVVWSLFFAMYKYFIWWVFKTDTITLQFISWYLSLGTVWAYIIWGLIYELIREKKHHLLSILWAIIIFTSIYFLSKNDLISNYTLIASATLLMWFFYWMWNVLKNILISSQIAETSIWDTKVNGLANIFFISSIIIWSILWWFIAEKLSINWIFVILIILIWWLVWWLFISYKDNSKNQSIKEKVNIYKNSFLNDFIFIFKKYFIIMLFASIIITIATILSQKAIEYNVEVLWKTGSSSSMILLFSAVWSIIWNIVSMKIKSNRWKYFFIFSILFWVSASLFPTFLNNFKYLSILAFISWLFFWIIFNLIESYFFKSIAIDDKKSYGSVTLWLITSLVIAFLMFFVDFLQWLIWFNWVYYFMWIVIFLMWVVMNFIWKEKS